MGLFDNTDFSEQAKGIKAKVPQIHITCADENTPVMLSEMRQVNSAISRKINDAVEKYVYEVYTEFQSAKAKANKE